MKRGAIAVAAVLGALLLALGLAACGGDGGGEEPTLDQATVTGNLRGADYIVVETDEFGLPSLVSNVGFVSGPDTGYKGAIQVSGNGLAPFDPEDVSETGFALFYETADQASSVDDSIGTGEGQRREGNVLFLYGNGVDPAPAEFDEMVGAAVGE